MHIYYVLSSQTDYQHFTGDETWNLPCPEPLPCKFCGKPRYFIGKEHTDDNDETLCVYWPERTEDFALPCSCAEGIKEYRLYQNFRLHKFHRSRRDKQLLALANYQSHFQLQEMLTAKDKPQIKANPDIQAACDTINSFFQHYEYLYRLPQSSGIRKGLFLYGKPGTGKTSSAIVLSRNLQMVNIPVLVCTGIELLTLLMDKIKANAELNETMEFFKKVEILILDDIDKITATPWAVNTLFELIDARNTAYLSTIFTSNHSIDELTKVFAKNPKTDQATVAALVDRIAGMTYPLHFGGKSQRQK